MKKTIGDHKTKKNEDSVVCEHHQNHKQHFDWENAKVVDFEYNYKKRTISKMLLVKSNKFAINKKEIFSLNKIFFPK